MIEPPVKLSTELILCRLDANAQPVECWRWDAVEGIPPVIRIGRGLDCAVQLHSSRVSRAHVELRWQADAWWLVSLGVNGTLVNGQFIQRFAIAATGRLQCAPGGPILSWQLPDPEFQRLDRQAVDRQAVDRQAVNRQAMELAGTPVDGELTCSQPQPQPDRSRLDVVSLRARRAPQLPPNFSSQLPSQLPAQLPSQVSHPGLPPSLPDQLPQLLPSTVESQRAIAKSSMGTPQVLQVLGRGGMGTTYLVRSQDARDALSSPYVLKTLNAEMLQVPKARQLFEREARMLQQLRHPGIPQFYDFFWVEGQAHLAMEWIEGQTLEAMVLEQGPIPVVTAIAWMVQVCEVLSYLHCRATPILHRDIKPSNLLLRTQDQRLMVIDFGAVKSLGWLPGTRIGAVGYSAPEQIKGQPTVASDLYSVAMTLLFLVTAQAPHRFYAQDGRVDLTSVAIAPRLKAMLERATQPRPRDRPNSAAVLAVELSQAAAELC